MIVKPKVKAPFVTAVAVGLMLATTSTSALAAPKAGDGKVSRTSSTAAASFCGTGRVESIANNLPIRDNPYHTANVRTIAQKGYQYNCFQPDPYYLSDRYTACGVSGANGWLTILFNDRSLGWAYMTCFKDV
ncbi:hypothetical protein ACGF5H_01600 [Micromonospora chalcea]